MPPKGKPKSPGKVQTRNTARNAEKPKGKQKEKLSDESSKATKTKPKGKLNTDVKEQEKVKAPSTKVGSKSKQRSVQNEDDKLVKTRNAKKQQSQEEELLDYDEEGLNNTLQSVSSDQLIETDSDSSGSSDTDSETDNPEEGQSDFTDNPSDSSMNYNNGASPPSDEELPAQNSRKRKSDSEVKTPQSDKTKRQKKEKTVKLTTSELQELMNKTIENYEKSRASDAEASTASKNTNSDTTLYSRLCPPGLNIPADHAPTQVPTFNAIIDQVEQMGVNDTASSDESMLVQLNSSDEITDNNNIAGRQLPPPPPSQPKPAKQAAQDKADDLIKQAELQKAELAKPPGEHNQLKHNSQFPSTNPTDEQNVDGTLDYLHNTGSAHVDATTRLKVKQQLYVDLARFLPRDLDVVDEDENLVLTNKDGKTYHVPPSERDLGTINTFKKWQLAFKVFMSIYMEEHPNKLPVVAPEFIQYMQLIEDMTTTWIWDNVYKYDKRHRRMMAQFKNRHWHVPYQAARAELKTTHIMHNFSQTNAKVKKQQGPGAKQRKEACRNFNRGKCTYGTTCRYDHKCSRCGKFGHGAFQCRQKDSTVSPDKNLKDNSSLD